MYLTLFTLLLAAAGFIWGKIRPDIVALAALVILTLSGVLTTEEALSGFSNSIVIMMIGLFVVGGAIFNTGLAKMIGAHLLKMAGRSETRLFLLVMGGTALIGGFVSNTGTVALMLPIAVSMAAGAGIAPGRLLMPLAFASSLGGMMTLIGTPPNLIIADMWAGTGGRPLTFFTFLPGGFICLLAGTLLLLPLSKWFLSGRGKASEEGARRTKSPGELVAEYGLENDLFRLTVAPGSLLVGRTLADLNVRRDYGIEVLEVRRDDHNTHLLRKMSHHAAEPTVAFAGGESIYARGSREEVSRFAGDFGMKVDGRAESRLQFYEIGIAEIVPLPNSPIIGRTIADLDFRNRYGVNVVGIRRKNTYINHNLAAADVHSGDVLLVRGSWKAIGALTRDDGLWVVLGQPLEEAARVTLDYKAPVAALIMLGMVAALVSGIVPAVMAVIVAGLLMVLTGCFRNVEDAYRTINWESIVLIAAMMPMSAALEKTGVSGIVSEALAGGLGTAGPLVMLAGIYFTTSFMTLFISNTATAVLLAPIAVSSAGALGVSPLPYLFAVSFGASLCFASPFSTPPNALVMPAGQYRFTDYLKVGLPLQLLLGLLMIFVLPLLFSF
ncbi:MAG: SLC13 family permease [Prevotellaceae bacterium]|nr:SLC13 family permease [Prevotellaceae bacterium]